MYKVIGDANDTDFQEDLNIVANGPPGRGATLARQRQYPNAFSPPVENESFIEFLYRKASPNVWTAPEENKSFGEFSFGKHRQLLTGVPVEKIHG